jgi:hypothetical protein
MQSVLEQFVRTLFSMTQGTGKARLNVNAEIVEVGNWETLIGAASNEPLLAYVKELVGGTDAGTMRLFEMELDPLPSTVDHAYGQELFKAFRSNYGIAGVEYAKYLVTHRKEVEQDVIDTQRMLKQALHAHSNDRFWIAIIAAVLVGSMHATRANLLKFDTGAILDHLVSIFNQHHNRTPERDTDVSLLEKFLEYAEPRTAITQKVNLGRGKPTDLVFVGKTDAMDLMRYGPPAVHVGVESGLVIIRYSAFAEWLHRRYNMLPHNFVTQLKREGFEETTITFLAGARSIEGKGRARVLMTSTHNPILRGRFEDLELDRLDLPNP